MTLQDLAARTPYILGGLLAYLEDGCRSNLMESFRVGSEDDAIWQGLYHGALGRRVGRSLREVAQDWRDLFLLQLHMYREGFGSISHEKCIGDSDSTLLRRLITQYKSLKVPELLLAHATEQLETLEQWQVLALVTTAAQRGRWDLVKRYSTCLDFSNSIEVPLAKHRLPSWLQHVAQAHAVRRKSSSGNELYAPPTAYIVLTPLRFRQGTVLSANNLLHALKHHSRWRLELLAFFAERGLAVDQPVRMRATAQDPEITFPLVDILDCNCNFELAGAGRRKEVCEHEQELRSALLQLGAQPPWDSRYVAHSR
eukprot:TRINITY_DN51097_c0_g1_i1.p1 TRINITY_DN51097_c0_g1~~TRINITY_DN51097_c0_g1_i1.p1  ORF type:complete len:312 (-),score=24.84 TRINITY_DN51097_c0_g1_i1:11-946(-)